MRSLGYALYNWLVIPGIYMVINMSWLASPKIRATVKGRKGLFEKLKNESGSIAGGYPRIWIHCSSMGEFEQAKPVISGLKERFPEGRMIITFFSPSVLDHINEVPGADFFCYLPFDSIRNARRFYELLRPDAAMVIRHDIWPNHLRELRRVNAPALLINSSVRAHRLLRFPLTSAIRRFTYNRFDRILAVSRETKMLLKKNRLYRGEINVVGDTRYDQVVNRANGAQKVIEPLIKFKRDRKVFVAGSTWPSDDEVIFAAWQEYHQSHKRAWMIHIPHEPTEDNIARIEGSCAEAGLRTVRFSRIMDDSDGGDVLIVDRFGILASLYALGDLTYVGGSFGPGVHNVLEPAALGRIVIFGPRHTNSYEARMLKKREIGFCIEDSADLLEILTTYLDDSPERLEKENATEQLVEENRGATGRILNTLEEMLAAS